MTATPLLEMRDLYCERDERVLFSGLNMQLWAGELVQVVGPNGAGKTTLLRILTGISADFDGDLFWQGKPLRSQRHDFAADLLYLGHNPGIKKALSPAENLGFYASLSGGYTASIHTMLKAVGLAGYEDVPCYQLSAGQQRRVGLARLYGSRAKLWVLDEPFTAVDKAGVIALEERFAAHVAAGGSVILTSHQALSLSPLRQLDLQLFAGEAA